MTDRQRHEDAPQGLLLGLVEVVDELAAVGGQDVPVHDPRLGHGVRVGQLLLGGGPRVERHPGHVLGAQVEQRGLVGDHAGVQERDRALPAERLDVEPAARRQAGEGVLETYRMFTRSRSWLGQERALGQRMSLSPSFS